jgi:hypothetical protein
LASEFTSNQRLNPTIHHSLIYQSTTQLTTMDINAKQTDVSSFDNEAVTNVQQENPPSSAGLSKEAM